MLKSLNLRRRGVTVISCPSCARQQFQVIKTVERLEKRLAHITTPLTVSVIGCVVNGPGEARETDIGFTGSGAAGKRGAGEAVEEKERVSKPSHNARVGHRRGIPALRPTRRPR